VEKPSFLSFYYSLKQHNKYTTKTVFTQICHTTTQHVTHIGNVSNTLQLHKTTFLTRHDNIWLYLLVSLEQLSCSYLQNIDGFYSPSLASNGILLRSPHLNCIATLYLVKYKSVKSK